MSATAAVVEAPPRALATPLLDALTGGGLSLAGVAVLLLIGPAATAPAVLARLLPLNLLLNWPHFMASYPLLYGSADSVRRHPVAAVVVPAGLVIWGAAALALFGAEPLVFDALHVTAAVYLAWHYTGQAWGSMAALAHVQGTPFDETDRRLVRANLRLLLVFHAVWALHQIAVKAGWTPVLTAYAVVRPAAALSAALGAAGLWRLRRRAGRLPAGVLLPWLAIHAWYALLFRDPRALFWVQLGHALQYLPYPLRVAANRAGGRPQAAAGRWLAGLVALGAVVFWGVPRALAGAAAWAGLAVPLLLVEAVVNDAVNVHHYFVDGCIWKLGDARVRRDLFAHLA